MNVQDTQLTVTAFFTAKPGKLDALKELSDRFVERTRKESRMCAYAWSFNGDEAHCRHRYQNAEGWLEHAENCLPLLMEALKISDCTRLAIHGPEEELAKIRGPMAKVEFIQYFPLRKSFRR